MKCAYVTLLSSDTYFWGVVCLHKSLQFVQSKYPLEVMITDNVSNEIIDNLNKLGINYRIFPYREFMNSTSNIPGTINKFYIYEFKEYDKVCFLDGDCLVKKNIDSIFFYSTPGLVSSDDFIYGGMFLVNPNDYPDFNFIYDNYKDSRNDDVVLPLLYNYKNSSALLGIFLQNVFHMSDNSDIYEQHERKYWNLLNITSVEDIDNLLENLDEKLTLFSKIYLGEEV